MDAILGLLTAIFWLGFFAVLIAAILGFKKYNSLRRRVEEMREKESNVGIAVQKKTNMVNQLIDMVKAYQESEQFTHLKISQDNSAMGLASAYQQTNTVLASLQTMAQRFPELKANEQYKMLGESIRECENEIQRSRQSFNAAVKDYNNERLAVPTVFYAKFIGFSKADYLEFAAAGGADAQRLKQFTTDDGERIQELLAGAGSHLMGATKTLASHASQASKVLAAHAGEASKMLAAKIQERSSVQYFYMLPGGVPQGPASLEHIRGLVAQGAIQGSPLLAEVGSQEWKPIEMMRVDSAPAPQA
jgi:LemA protein